MKVSYNIILSAAAALLLVGAPSCSLLHSSSNKVAGSTGQITSQRTADRNSTAKPLAPPKNGGAKTPSTSTEEPRGVKNKNKGKSESSAKPARGKNPVIPGQADNRRPLTDSLRLADAAANRSNVYNPNLDKNFTINGEWTIYSVRGNVVTGEERPYITFDLEAKRFYGNNGCNYVNGDLEVGKDGALHLGNMISTMKMCSDAEFEYLINLALDAVTAYSARVEGPITFLDLLDGKSTQPVLVLRRHNMDFLNGAWKVDTLNGTPLVTPDGDAASITINVADLQLHGTTGCNRLNGRIFIDPDKQRSLQFIDIATTRMMCPPDSRETEFLLALESVESARMTSSDTVVLTSPEGDELFTLTRIPLTTAQ